jgi:hypothetical protein
MAVKPKAIARVARPAAKAERRRRTVEVVIEFPF